MTLKKFTVTYGGQITEIPYYEIIGKSAGKSVFISAGIHGNEINGIFLVRNFVEWCKVNLDESKLAGKILIFPVLNPHGFAERIRQVPEDGKDLNRQFFDTTPKSMSEQIAYDLTHNFLKDCDMGVDIHDSGNYAMYVPHARIHLTDGDKCKSCSRELARIFGTENILERDGLQGMMAVA